jgi:hypothetical protein
MKWLILIFTLFCFGGCAATQSSFIPLKQEQLNGVYKIYHSNYASSGSEIADKQYITYICKDNAICIDNYKQSTQQVIYMQVIKNKYCKILDTTTEESERFSIKRLEDGRRYKCHFTNSNTNKIYHYKPGEVLIGFGQNRNGDFINSELITLKDGKIVDRRANFADEKKELYDKNGNKLTDKAYRKIFFPYDTCDKAAVAEGFDYSTLSIKATTNKTIVTQRINKSVEELAKSKFYLENKNSSRISIFPPFGYIIEILHKRYYIYDKDGNLIFGNLSWFAKINESRFYVQYVKDRDLKQTEAFLYDADNEKILFTADDIKSDNLFSVNNKHDLLVVIKDDKSGLIDFDGNIVVDYQSKYDFRGSYKGLVIGYNKQDHKYELLDLELKPITDNFHKVDFQDNLFAAYRLDRVTVFDYSKKILFDLEASEIKFYDKFFIANSRGNSTLYDYNGNKLYDKTYNNLKNIGGNLFSHQINDKTALMDINAKEIIPPVCDKITLNSCNILECITN